MHPVTPMGGDSQVDRKSIVIPPGHWELFDPFLMLAEDWFSTSGFDWHPHRGIATVTLVVDGALEHGDNRGHAGVLAPGDVQWMTAGSGIIHRELAHRDERAHTLQLWLNLPATHKMVESRYQDFTAEDFAVEVGDGTRVEVVSGSSGGLTGPASTHWPVTGRRLSVEPGRSLSLPLPGDHRGFLYVLSGRLRAGSDRIEVGAGEVAWSDPHAAGTGMLELEAPEGDEVVHAILFSGRPIGEPVVAGGPFVMNSAAEIRQAYVDFHAGRFGDVPALTRL